MATLLFIINNFQLVQPPSGLMFVRLLSCWSRKESSPSSVMSPLLGGNVSFSISNNVTLLLSVSSDSMGYKGRGIYWTEVLRFYKHGRLSSVWRTIWRSQAPHCQNQCSPEGSGENQFIHENDWIFLAQEDVCLELILCLMFIWSECNCFHLYKISRIFL